MRPEHPDWLAAARGALAGIALGARVEHRGRVEEIGDGVAMVSGLRGVRLDEVLRFEGGQVGFARVLDPDQIGCVLLDAATDVGAGDAVFGTGEVIAVPVGEVHGEGLQRELRFLCSLRDGLGDPVQGGLRHAAIGVVA